MRQYHTLTHNEEEEEGVRLRTSEHTRAHMQIGLKCANLVDLLNVILTHIKEEEIV